MQQDYKPHSESMPHASGCPNVSHRLLRASREATLHATHQERLPAMPDSSCPSCPPQPSGPLQQSSPAPPLIPEQPCTDGAFPQRGRYSQGGRGWFKICFTHPLHPEPFTDGVSASHALPLHVSWSAQFTAHNIQSVFPSLCPVKRSTKKH